MAARRVNRFEIRNFDGVKRELRSAVLKWNFSIGGQFARHLAAMVLIDPDNEIKLLNSQSREGHASLRVRG